MQEFNDLPIEIKKMIASFLNPRSLFIFSLLNKSTFMATKDNKVKKDVMKKMPPKRLYEVCYNYQNIAELALSDEKLAQILASYITSYDTRDLGGLSGSNAIANLCYQHKGIARIVISSPNLMRHLNDGNDIDAIAQEWEDLAIDILENPMFANQLEGDNLARIGTYNLEAAKLIVRTPNLLNKMSEKQLVLVLYGDEDEESEDVHNELFGILQSTVNDKNLPHQFSQQEKNKLNQFIKKYIPKKPAELPNKFQKII